MEYSTPAPELFQQFFEETYPIFEETKKYSLLIEKLGGKVEIGPINEQRSTLFHLYRFNGKPEEIQQHYIEAKEHLYRACYDTYVILVGILMDKIYSVKETFGVEIIVAVCPDYYNRIAPELNSLLQEIVKIRGDRLTNHDVAGKTYSVVHRERYETIRILLEWHQQLESLMNLFVEYRDELREKERRKSNKELFIRISIAVISILITLAVEKYIIK